MLAHTRTAMAAPTPAIASGLRVVPRDATWDGERAVSAAVGLVFETATIERVGATLEAPEGIGILLPEVWGPSPSES